MCEVTDLVDLARWPEGTWLIIRRQPLHPGTQASLLPDLEYRFWGHYTDCDGDSIELDRQMRAHAHVERPHSTPERLWARTVPIHRIRSEPRVAPNRLPAADLVVWFQLLCLTGPLALARPKRLRWDLWHAPARIISTARRDIIRIPDGWPTADVIVAAYQNIAALNTVNVDAVSVAPTAANQTRLTSEKTAPTRQPDPAPRYTTPSIVPPPHNHQPRHPNTPPVNDRG